MPPQLPKVGCRVPHTPGRYPCICAPIRARSLHIRLFSLTHALFELSKQLTCTHRRTSSDPSQPALSDTLEVPFRGLLLCTQCGPPPSSTFPALVPQVERHPHTQGAIHARKWAVCAALGQGRLPRRFQPLNLGPGMSHEPQQSREPAAQSLDCHSQVAFVFLVLSWGSRRCHAAGEQVLVRLQPRQAEVGDSSPPHTIPPTIIHTCTHAHIVIHAYMYMYTHKYTQTYLKNTQHTCSHT